MKTLLNDLKIFLSHKDNFTALYNSKINKKTTLWYLIQKIYHSVYLKLQASLFLQYTKEVFNLLLQRGS